LDIKISNNSNLLAEELRVDYTYPDFLVSLQKVPEILTHAQLRMGSDAVQKGI
jgi:hypothetical protein